MSEKKNKKIGVLLYLIFVLQRLNIALTLIFLFSSLFLLVGLIAFAIFRLENFQWTVSIFNIGLCICSLLGKCLTIPLKEFLTVFVISFFESTKMYDELLELPASLLEKLNLKLKDK